ncbi:hypothetical protein [Pseudomonas lactis]
MFYACKKSKLSFIALSTSTIFFASGAWGSPPNSVALDGHKGHGRGGCTWDRNAALSYEEQRLTTALPFTGNNVTTQDETPLAERITKDTGFDTFEPAFAEHLCGQDNTTTVTSYSAAQTLVTKEGQALWRAAVDRVQGRRPSPSDSVLPNSDDRMLYWARTYMTRTLRQWVPSFTLSKTQADDLQWRFERASRGQYDIELPRKRTNRGAAYRRMIVSGFDVFSLGQPGTPNTGLRNGNPSGATALEMDGREFRLSDGSILHVEAYLLPVSYDPFNRGMQEDTLGPWFQPGPQRVDASITMSQGGPNQFWLEAWNGRFHGSYAGNDGIVYCPAAQASPAYVLPLGTVTNPGTSPISLAGSGCNINTPPRWLGYDGTWEQNQPPQFSAGSLPVQELLTADTGRGIKRPTGASSASADGFDVTWHTNYSYYSDCSKPSTVDVPTNDVVNAIPDPSLVTAPLVDVCARNGGGGDFLSNESGYRNTVLRDAFGLNIPAGHIHVPIMNNYFTNTGTGIDNPRNDNAITDGLYESYRTAIVAQTKAMLVEIGNTLTQETKRGERPEAKPL